jgi:hypothetical protein
MKQTSENDKRKSDKHRLLERGYSRKDSHLVSACRILVAAVLHLHRL